MAISFWNESSCVSWLTTRKFSGEMGNDILEPLVDSFHRVVVVSWFTLYFVCQNCQVDSMLMSLVRISIVMQCLKHNAGDLDKAWMTTKLLYQLAVWLERSHLTFLAIVSLFLRCKSLNKTIYKNTSGNNNLVFHSFLWGTHAYHHFIIKIPCVLKFNILYDMSQHNLC